MRLKTGQVTQNRVNPVLSGEGGMFGDTMIPLGKVRSSHSKAPNSSSQGKVSFPRLGSQQQVVSRLNSRYPFSRFEIPIFDINS